MAGKKLIWFRLRYYILSGPVPTGTENSNGAEVVRQGKKNLRRRRRNE